MKQIRRMLEGHNLLILVRSTRGCERSPEEVPAAQSPAPAPQATPVVSISI